MKVLSFVFLGVSIFLNGCRENHVILIEDSLPIDSSYKRVVSKFEPTYSINRYEDQVVILQKKILLAPIKAK